MAASKTSIANMALSRVGAQPLMDLELDATVEAEVCRVWYEQTVRAVTRDHPWNFLVKRAVLARLAAVPAFGWTYRYGLPDDLVTLLTVNGYRSGEPEALWELEADRAVNTNAEACEITYVHFSDAPGQYDPGFTECLVVLLAANISHQLLRGTAGLGQVLRQEYERTLSRYAMREANEGRINSQRRVLDSSLIQSRHRGSVNGPWEVPL